MTDENAGQIVRLAAVALLAALSACAPGGSDGKEVERRFEQCMEAGGTYSEGWGDEFKCELPYPEPLVTITETVTP